MHIYVYTYIHIHIYIYINAREATEAEIEVAELCECLLKVYSRQYAPHALKEAVGGAFFFPA